MKITRRQLRQIIKEEKTWTTPDGWGVKVGDKVKITTDQTGTSRHLRAGTTGTVSDIGWGRRGTMLDPARQLYLDLILDDDPSKDPMLNSISTQDVELIPEGIERKMRITRHQLRQIVKEAFWSKKEIKSIEDVQTVGDLRKLIASAQDAKRWEQTKGEAGDAVKGAIVDEILGKIPGASAAKSMFDFVKSSYELPDEARTGTALDALDVDDHIAAIVDDPVENDFLSVFAEDLKSQDGDTPIADINMTMMLSKHLKGKFDGRTVDGFQEGRKMKLTKRQLRKLIKESIIAEAGYDQLPFKGGQPWRDPDIPYEMAANLLQRDIEQGVADELDRELTDQEMDDAGYFEEDGWPLTFSYADKTGEQVEYIANNNAEADDFFSMFFKEYGRDYPYSVN